MKLKEIARSAATFALERRARKKLEVLARDDDPTVRLLAQVVTESIEQDLNPEEKQLLDKIEALRTRLNASTTQIVRTDYGAGSKEEHLKEKGIAPGRDVATTVGAVCTGASKPRLWSLVLFKLIRHFKPFSCLELGTCLGISAAYQAGALQLNGSGKLVTIEGANALGALAAGNLKGLGLNNASVVTGRFEDTLDGVLRDYKPLEFAFIDGHHDEEATKAYYKQILPFTSKKSVFVFDDIVWSDGMKRAWKTIEQDERVRISVNMRQFGICVVDPLITRKQAFTLWLL